MAKSNLPLGNVFQSIDEVLGWLSEMERALLAIKDRRGVFVTAYLRITAELQRRIGAGQFRDNAWVGRYVISFANLYRQAFVDYETGNRAAVPKAWALAFDTAKAGTGLVIQDLMLGINAHINRDLPFALAEVGIDPDRESRYDDHTAVNDALREATQPVQDAIAKFYASGLGLLDKILGPLDEQLTAFSFRKAREQAWTLGVALVNAAVGPDRERAQTAIETHAGAMARLVLSPNVRFPWLIDALRALEQMSPAWIATSEFLPVGAMEMTTIAFESVRVVQAAPTSLDEVIAWLGQMIDSFDQQRSRLSIYPTVYRRITRKVKAAAEQGLFQDPAWMVKLDLNFADRFFRTMEAYRAGRLGDIPRCWAFALESVRVGRTMIVQDIALQIVPRVVFDLPLTLRDVGMDGDLAARHHDYEATYQLFTDELDDIQDMIAEKYSRLVAFEDVLGGRLDEMISDELYTAARKAAWEDGLELFQATTVDRVAQLTERLDRKATRMANEFLFWDLPPFSWMCKVVRDLEDVFPGTWSEMIDS